MASNEEIVKRLEDELRGLGSMRNELLKEFWRRRFGPATIISPETLQGFNSLDREAVGQVLSERDARVVEPEGRFGDPNMQTMPNAPRRYSPYGFGNRIEEGTFWRNPDFFRYIERIEAPNRERSI